MGREPDYGAVLLVQGMHGGGAGAGQVDEEDPFGCEAGDEGSWDGRGDLGEEEVGYCLDGVLDVGKCLRWEKENSHSR